MPDFIIINATILDALEIARVQFLSWHAEFAKDLSKEYVEKQSFEFLTNYWEEYFKKNMKSIVLVALQDDEIVGFIAILKQDNVYGDSEVDKLYINPQNQRQGIGKALMKHALNTLILEGFTKTILKTFVKNSKAHAFYEDLGAKLIKEEDVLDYHEIIRMRIYRFDQ